MSVNLTPSKSQKASRILRWIWVTIGSVFILWVLLFELDWASVGDALQMAQYGWVTFGILVTILAILVRTWRWQVLLYRHKTRAFGIMSALLFGQAVNLVLPLRSGDLMRVIWYHEMFGAGGAEALGTVAIEKVWDIIALLLCGILLLVYIPLPYTYFHTIWSTGIFLAFGVALLLLGLRWQKEIIQALVVMTGKFPHALRVLILPRVEQLIHGIDVIRQSRVSAWVFGLTLWVWAAGVIANWAVMAAFGVYSLSAALLLMVTLMSGNVIVPIPGRFGVFEAIVVASLVLYDVPGDTALAIGLVLHMVSMGTPMVVAIILALVNAVRRMKPIIVD